jgi:tyrosyl-tRNA synthetase
MTAYLKDAEISKKLKELVFNRRHKHLSIIFLVQSWISVPKDIRKMFSNIFIFKVSKIEMENIFNEVIELSKDYIMPLMKIVYDKPYQFLFINTDSQRLFKGFDELIIS